MMRILAIITARENSKRCRKKNLRKMGERSITKIAVDKARELKLRGVVTDYVLSTDSLDLLSECFYPDMLSVKPRKAHLSGDNVKSADVVTYLLETLSDKGDKYDAVLILQPTSPLAQVEHIEEAVDRFVSSDADSLISACRLENVSINGLYMEADGEFKPVSPGHNSGTRKQELPVLYLRNGAIYITKTEYIERTHLLISEKPQVYVMPKDESADIDSEEDFNAARDLYIKKYGINKGDNDSELTDKGFETVGDENYKLSICIPTYNRPQVLKKCIDNLIEWTNESIEIVVIDDCSPVNIEDYIRTEFSKEGKNLDNIRFYRNMENMGASYNSYVSFMKARGDYALLISDEDDLIAGPVNNIMQQLTEDPGIVGCFMSGRRGENDLKHFDDRIYKDAFSFLRELGFSTRYMTGVMFKRKELIRAVGIVSFRDAQKIFNVYSFMVIAAFISFRGKILTSSEEAYTQKRFTQTTKNTNPKDAPDIFYFEPEGRKQQIKSWVMDISGMDLDIEQKKVLLKKIYKDACKVAFRIFDPYQQKQYQRMIPQYYDIFLDHIKGYTKDSLSKELLDTVTDSAQLYGIMPKNKLQEMIQKDEG